MTLSKDLVNLLLSSQRSDGFVCTKPWCQKYKKRTNDFLSLPESRKYIQTLSDALGGLQVVECRPGIGSYIHPMVFMALLRWLDVGLYQRVLPNYSAFFGHDCRES